jgi:hypothetical protein
MTLIIAETQHENALCCVCRDTESHFICNAECHYVECLYAECLYAECLYAECLYAERRYAECKCYKSFHPVYYVFRT